MKKHLRVDFILYCKALNDKQLISVYHQHVQANTREQVEIASNEMKLRGLQ